MTRGGPRKFANLGQTSTQFNSGLASRPKGVAITERNRKEAEGAGWDVWDMMEVLKNPAYFREQLVQRIR